VLSLRVDADLWDRVRAHAAKRGMSAQDYVIGTLVRDDFDQRFQAAVDETERFYAGPAAPGGADLLPAVTPSPGLPWAPPGGQQPYGSET
jgi:hypothetical protein